MKKTYMIPATKVIRIEKVLLQNSSPATPNAGGSTNNVNDLLGRGGYYDEGEE